MKIKEMKSRRLKVEVQDEVEGGAALLGFDDQDNTQCSQMNDWPESGEQKHSPQPCSRWTPENTRLMLQLRFERQHDFQQRLRQKKELWSEIAAEMRNQGQADFTITAEVCDLKYRNMLQTYKKNRLKEDSGMQSLIVWEYYELFKEALKASEEAEAQEGQERVVPSMLCESVCEAVGNDEDEGVGVVAASSDVDANGPQQLPNAADEMLNGETTAQNNNEERSESMVVAIPVAGSYSRKRTRTSMRHAATMQNAEFPPPQTPAAVTTELMTDSDVEEKTMKPHKSNEMQRQNNANHFVQRSSVKRPRRAYSAMHEAQNEVSELPPNVQNELVQAAGTSLGAHHTVEVTAEWPTNSELREYQVFGESIGLQLANVREAKVRALLQFKIQELFYKAKTGKLVEDK